MINKALIEIPYLFRERVPVGDKRLSPKATPKKKQDPTSWPRATGLTEDILRYGTWMREQAAEKIGHLYPQVKITKDMVNKRPDLKPMLGQELTVIAYLWARTVESPNPAYQGCHVPLVRSFTLSSKSGKSAWVEPIVDEKSYTFKVCVGEQAPEQEGTIGRKGGRCILSDSPIPLTYIRDQGKKGKLKQRLLAIVLEGNKKRIYLGPDRKLESNVEKIQRPVNIPNAKLPKNPRDFKTPNYGMTTFGSLFTPRQLVALTTFSDLVQEVKQKVIRDALAAGWDDDGRGLEEGGEGATAYGDAVATYVALAVGRSTDYWSSLCSWNVPREQISHVFTRQAI
ncbi:MAG: hypothetical protein AAGJ35_02485, partial [Myxococcota bacterium]